MTLTDREETISLSATRFLGRGACRDLFLLRKRCPWELAYVDGSVGLTLRNSHLGLRDPGLWAWEFLRFKASPVLRMGILQASEEPRHLRRVNWECRRRAQQTFINASRYLVLLCPQAVRAPVFLKFQPCGSELRAWFCMRMGAL